MKTMKWTLCSNFGGRTKKWAQYGSREVAEKIAAENGDGWFVKLCPVNPERVVTAGGRRKSMYRKKVGLVQF